MSNDFAKQLEQIIQAFAAMQKVQQQQSLDMNTTSVNITYIQKDIETIKNSVNDQSKVYATKEELANVIKDTVSLINNVAASIRQEVKLPLKIVYSIASVVGLAVVGAILKLVIK